MTNQETLPDENGLEVVAVSTDPAEATMIEELLKNNGIDCTLQGDITAVFPAGDLDDIKILVQPKDLEKAQELVDAFFTPLSEQETQETESEPGSDETTDTIE
jgi:hypothetical protein